MKLHIKIQGPFTSNHFILVACWMGRRELLKSICSKSFHAETWSWVTNVFALVASALIVLVIIFFVRWSLNLKSIQKSILQLVPLNISDATDETLDELVDRMDQFEKDRVIYGHWLLGLVGVFLASAFITAFLGWYSRSNLKKVIKQTSSG